GRARCARTCGRTRARARRWRGPRRSRPPGTWCWWPGRWCWWGRSARWPPPAWLHWTLDETPRGGRPRAGPGHGGRRRRPVALPQDQVRRGDVGPLVAGDHPLPAPAAVLPSAALRRAAPPRPRLLAEPPRLDERRVRQEPPLLRPGHPRPGAARPRQEQRG